MNYEKQAKQLLSEMENKHGYVFCQHCGKNGRISIHHLIYRSEKVKHEHLHNKRNLLILCESCHSEAHKHKHEFRKQYIEQRNLTELFGNDILPLTL